MLGTGFFFTYEAGKDSIRADMAVAVQKAVKVARENERKKQDEVNAITQTQYNNVAAINDQLNADLIRLRDRTSRGQLPNNSKANCKGTSGTELSGEDAGFLARESARADRLRAALEACYNYADSLNK